MNARCVLAVDPGSHKCGMATVRRVDDGTLEILWHKIAPKDEFAEWLVNAHEIEPFDLVIVGSGTKSREIVSIVREEMPSMATLVVDERDTSIQARERYWEVHKRRGWRRFLPASLQIPPEPIDDFAAVILAERVLLQS